MLNSLRRLLGPWGHLELSRPDPARVAARDAELDRLEETQREIRARLRLLEIQGTPRREVR